MEPDQTKNPDNPRYYAGPTLEPQDGAREIFLGGWREAERRVSLSLLAPVAGAMVSVAPDTQAITSAISNFVAAFAAQNAQYINPVLVISLKQSYGYRAAELAAIGITQDISCTLTVNQGLLANAVQNNLGPGGNRL